MITVEVYESDGGTITVVKRGENKHLIPPDANLLRTITESDWGGCMYRHHELMGWEPYKYVDKNGKEIRVGQKVLTTIEFFGIISNLALEVTEVSRRLMGTPINYPKDAIPLDIEFFADDCEILEENK